MLAPQAAQRSISMSGMAEVFIVPLARAPVEATCRQHICHADKMGARPLWQQETLFYDGHCGLCHHAVKFVLKHDHGGQNFRFAPLQGETFKLRVPRAQRARLPDSMVVQTLDGSLLLRSDAWIHIFRRLGGGWRLSAGLLSVIPRVVRDVLYNIIASIRYRVFHPRDELCPLVPPELGVRFDP